MKNLAKIFIRIYSIYLIMSGILSLPNLISMIDFNWIFYIIIHSSLMSVCGILLWVFSDAIASKIVSDDTINDDISLNYSKIQKVAFSVVGIIILINAVPSITRNIWDIIRLSNTSPDIDKADMLKPTVDIVENAIKAIMGIWLLLGSKGIVNLIRKARKYQFYDMDANNDLETVDKTEVKNDNL